MPLTVCCWKWGRRFSALHVNVLRAALERHLQIPFVLICITDDRAGLDPRIVVVPMPTTFASTPRCRRRMQQFDRDFSRSLGDRLLYIDLDVVIVRDLTDILSRLEPIVGWKVGHAGVYSGSFLLADAGALHGAWAQYAADPDGYPVRVQPRGVPSDQAMLNHYIATQPPIGTWTEADGFVTYYGAGYERLEHLGVGPTHRELPEEARIVVLGSADLEVLQDDTYPWVREHWTPLAAECLRAA